MPTTKRENADTGAQNSSIKEGLFNFNLFFVMEI